MKGVKIAAAIGLGILILFFCITARLQIPF